ncbi:MAG TPA: tetratricopeptide repeat protein [Bryobacteraceae bacterium]|nr:tetratricopeptide repeat protein [Bryobacteraceae bacterium]
MSALSLILFTALHAAPKDPLPEGKQAFASGAYQDAVQLLSRVTDPPGVCEASFYLGLSRYRLKQIDEAIVALEIAAACPGASPQIGLALGQAYIEKGDHNRAAASLEKVLNREPSNVDALRSLSSLYLRHELNDKAIPLLERLTATSPSDVQSRADLGAAYGGLMNLQKAREQFDLALQSKPDYLPALVGLANVHIRSGETEQGLTLLNRAIAAGAQSYEPYFLRGVAHAKAERYKEAVADLAKAVSLGATDPEVYYHLSRVYRALGETAKSQEALVRFKTSRADSEQRTEAVRQTARFMQEAKSLVQAGNLSAAADVLERAAALEVPDPQLYYRLASLYLDLNRLVQAAERSRVAVRLAPAEWTYRYLLGMIELKQGNLQLAREQLEIALRLNASAADVLNALGDVAMRERLYADAVRLFQKAVQLKPDVAAYRLNLEAAQQSVR